MHFEQLPYAQAFRDVIRELIIKELDSERPTASLATVDTIDRVTGTCNVIFPGDTISVPVKMFVIQPDLGGGVGIGDVVQIEGPHGKRYVSRVVKGKAYIAAGKLAIQSTDVTGAASNMYIDSVTGLISRTTSSIRYKKLIQDVSPNDLAVMDLRVITYKSNDYTDDRRFIGLIAEELAASDNETLHYLVSYDTEGNPDSVNYDRVSMIVVPAVQRIITKMVQFNTKINQNKTDITSLTARVTSLEASLQAALARITTLEQAATP